VDAQREAMVREQIEARGVADPAVLRAMLTVRRERFMPAASRWLAYEDGPAPIGHGQTISQPYIVALMTELLGLRPGDRVLEVGTGCGYQAAVLACIAREVHSLEILAPLYELARENLAAEGFDDVCVHLADGWAGWPGAAPWDAILVAAAPERVPPALVDQLAPGARLVLPVGSLWGGQHLLRLTRTATGVQEERLIPVRFVPMTGGG
jgi:protein-L-isoaspartate(D-aspartate) O-methyltransferase